MLRKTIAFQRLFMASTPLPNLAPEPRKVLLAIALWVSAFIALIQLPGEIVLPVILTIATVWTINRNLNNGPKLIKLIPVSKKFIVFNIYLAAAYLPVIAFTVYWVLMVGIFGIIAGIIYLVQPQGGGSAFPAPQPVVGNLPSILLLIFILVLILAIGTTIALVANRKWRNSAFATFFVIGYGLLYYLKSLLPASYTLGEEEFMVAFSTMNEANQIISVLSIVAVLLVPLSVFAGYKMYMSKGRNGS